MSKQQLVKVGAFFETQCTIPAPLPRPSTLKVSRRWLQLFTLMLLINTHIANKDRYHRSQVTVPLTIYSETCSKITSWTAWRYPPPQITRPVGEGQEYGLVPVFKFTLGGNIRGCIQGGWQSHGLIQKSEVRSISKRHKKESVIIR